jgi:hypothetical protein
MQPAPLESRRPEITLGPRNAHPFLPWLTPGKRRVARLGRCSMNLQPQSAELLRLLRLAGVSLQPARETWPRKCGIGFIFF